MGKKSKYATTDKPSNLSKKQLKNLKANGEDIPIVYNFSDGFLEAELDKFCDKMGIPHFQIETDNYGQVLFYTGLVIDHEDEVSGASILREFCSEDCTEEEEDCD